MANKDIRDIRHRKSVLAAVKEYDALGGEAFLKKYKFGKGRNYFLKHNGKIYDSKAIVGAAYGYEFPDQGALTPYDFSGGKATVQRLLEGLGFEMAVLDEGDRPLEKAIQQAEQEGAFNLKDSDDARKKTLAAIVRRQGQPAFRKELLDAYSSRCVITGCDVSEALEAAHIYPYKGEQTNHVTNGLLLRADLHTLFDLGLITIDSSTFKVVIAPALKKTAYAELAGQVLRLPADTAKRPSKDALDWHMANTRI